jgi:hypothetical protein
MYIYISIYIFTHMCDSWKAGCLTSILGTFALAARPLPSRGRVLVRFAKGGRGTGARARREPVSGRRGDTLMRGSRGARFVCHVARMEKPPRREIGLGFSASANSRRKLEASHSIARRAALRASSAAWENELKSQGTRRL